MVGMINEAASVTADVLLKKGHAVLKAVYVTKSGAAGSLINLRDGTTAAGPIILTIEGEAVHQVPFINKPFTTGLFADHVTGGSYLVVWE